MNTPIEDVLSAWLDDTEENPVAESAVALGESSESIAESLLVHGLLIDVGCRDDEHEAEKIRELMQRIDFGSPVEKVVKTFDTTSTRPKLLTSFATLVTIATALTLMVVVFGPQQSVTAEMASLHRLIEKAKQPNDRSYMIRVVEEYSQTQRPKNVSVESWNRESREHLDGATLYVRGPDRFVLIRTLVDGRQRVSGYDGVESWSFREDGPVHVSSGSERFRGRMPGQNQTLPFLDMHASLTQLRENYEINLSKPSGERWSQLYGVRKSRDVRGPKEVDIWFDEMTGTVQRMVLFGLPPHRGAPKAVSLELIDQLDRRAEFYSHESHHEPGRRIKREGERR